MLLHLVVMLLDKASTNFSKYLLVTVGMRDLSGASDVFAVQTVWYVVT